MFIKENIHIPLLWLITCIDLARVVPIWEDVCWVKSSQAWPEVPWGNKYLVLQCVTFPLQALQNVFIAADDRVLQC